MKRNILTIIFCMAGSAAICWLCDWKTKAIAWMLMFWVVLAVGVAGAMLSDHIRAKKKWKIKRGGRTMDVREKLVEIEDDR